MSSTKPVPFEARFSHEFEDGPAGPARSYWNLQSQSGATVGTVCLHHRSSGSNPKLQAQSIALMLDQAFAAGRAEKAQEIRKALGI